MKSNTNKPKYVCGFLYDSKRENIVLLKRNSPVSQKGKFNGLGGKVDIGERPLEAMIREFKEEAGITVEKWTEFATLEQNEGISYFFHAVSDKFSQVITAEKQEVRIINIQNELHDLDLITNVRWLILLSLDADMKYANIISK
jgi:8-oxo-dGTP diphosphatase